MNKTDLDQFSELVESPMRSEKRERALSKWNSYKLSKQMAYLQHQKKAGQIESFGKSGVWTKGDYIKSLTAPAIDLRKAKLTDVCVGYVDLRGALLDNIEFEFENQSWSALKGAKLEHASLRRATLPEICLLEADLRNADLTNANLVGADLSNANLAGANLKDANLTGVNLERTNLVGANVEGCYIDEARVYGVSAWDLKGKPKSSRNLIVTPFHLPVITTDNIRVAQFIYLLINNPEIRDVLDTVTRKVVLLLGRFTPERKAILNALRDELRKRNLVPVLFDFEAIEERDITETITLLARISRFVIADLTEPASIPQELQAIAPDVAVPIRLIIQEKHKPYSMSKDLRKYPWVIKPYRYLDLPDLLSNLKSEIIDVAENTIEAITKSKSDEGW